MRIGGSDPLRQWVEQWAGRPPLNALVAIEGPRAKLNGEYAGTYPLQPSASIVVDATAVANATIPTHYETLWLGERMVIVARDATATPSALLDVRIDLPAQTRSVSDAMDEWAAAIEGATGDRIVLDHGLTTRATTSVGGSDLVAREALATILDAQHPALVWSLYWMGDAWFLSVRTIWSVVERTPPPGVKLQEMKDGPWVDGNGRPWEPAPPQPR